MLKGLKIINCAIVRKMEAPLVVDGSFLEGGGQILRLAISYSAILGIPIRVISIRANRPKPGLAQQHLNGIKLVADMCGGDLKGAYLGSTEVEFYPKTVKGGFFKMHLTTAGSIALMLQSALPVSLFAKNDVQLSLGGGTDCSFAPLIDYTIDVLGFYLKKFDIDLNLVLKQRGLFPKGGGRVEAHIKKLEKPLKPLVIEEAGKCCQINTKVIYTGPESDKGSHYVVKSIEKTLESLKSSGIQIKTDRIRETRMIPNSADTILLDVTYITDKGVKCSTSRIFDNPRNNKRKFDRNSHPETFHSQSSKIEQVSSEAANEIINLIKNSACCDSHMQDQLIVFMALAEGTSRIVVDQITDHTRTTQYVTHLLTKAEINFIPIDNDSRYIIECKGIGMAPK